MMRVLIIGGGLIGAFYLYRYMSARKQALDIGSGYPPSPHNMDYYLNSVWRIPGTGMGPRQEGPSVA